MIDPAILAQFTGSTTWYRNRMFPRYRYTEGVKYVLDAGQAYWLLDAIFSWQIEGKVAAEPFQVWKLSVEDSKGVLTCQDGNGYEVAVQSIPYTDFESPEITIWFTDDCALLPSEY
jgi:hypothetical protein